MSPLLSFTFFIIASLIGFAGSVSTVSAQSSVYKSTEAIKHTDAIRKNRPFLQDDDQLTHYDIALCAEYLSLGDNHHYHFADGIGNDEQKITPANLDQIDILGKQTVLQFQPAPALENKTTKKTTTTQDDNTTTETIHISNQNSASVSSATPIKVALDHVTGLVLINGQIPSQLVARQLQESCRAAMP